MAITLARARNLAYDAVMIADWSTALHWYTYALAHLPAGYGLHPYERDDIANMKEWVRTIHIEHGL